MFVFVPGEACTIVLRGATQQILDEAERSLHDALCVLSQTVKETRTVYGGGPYNLTLNPPSLHLFSTPSVCLCWKYSLSLTSTSLQKARPPTSKSAIVSEGMQLYYNTLTLARITHACVSFTGCSEMLMAKVVSDLANRTPGKEAVAMESFAKALMMVSLLTSLFRALLI